MRLCQSSNQSTVQAFDRTGTPSFMRYEMFSTLIEKAMVPHQEFSPIMGNVTVTALGNDQYLSDVWREMWYLVVPFWV
jgi:hypothetical protein